MNQNTNLVSHEDRFYISPRQLAFAQNKLDTLHTISIYFHYKDVLLIIHVHHQFLFCFISQLSLRIKIALKSHIQNKIYR